VCCSIPLPLPQSLTQKPRIEDVGRLHRQSMVTWMYCESCCTSVPCPPGPGHSGLEAHGMSSYVRLQHPFWEAISWRCQRMGICAVHLGTRWTGGIQGPSLSSGLTLHCGKSHCMLSDTVLDTPFWVCLAPADEEMMTMAVTDSVECQNSFPFVIWSCSPKQKLHLSLLSVTPRGRGVLFGEGGVLSTSLASMLFGVPSDAMCHRPSIYPLS